MNIRELLNSYIEIFPDEVADLALLAEQLGRSEDVITRKNFVGHVTVSGFVLNEDTKKVLLLEHKALSKLLQPGGHIEPEDNSLLDAVLREITEETGLTKERVRILPVSAELREVPFDIDVHYIPENKKKGEAGHYHHDFRYLFTTNADEVEIDPEESNEHAWIEWDDFVQIPLFAKVANKISSMQR